MFWKPVGSKALKRLIQEVKSIDPAKIDEINRRRPIFIVAGQPGIGRTTLINNVVERLLDDVPSREIRGFYTAELRDEGTRIGYEVVSLEGQRGILAHVDDSKGSSGKPLIPMGNHYKIDVAGFEAVALPALQIRPETSLYVIDEIGKMELCSSKFFPAVEKVLLSKTPVIASIPVPRWRSDDITEVERVAYMPDVHYHKLSRANRADTEDLIFTLLNRIC